MKLLNSSYPEGKCGECAARQHTHAHNTQHTTHTTHHTPHHTPHTTHHTPHTPHHTPHTTHHTPHTRHQTPDTRHQTPDTRHQTPDTREERERRRERERREERRERHIQIHLQMCFYTEKTRHPRVRPHLDLPWNTSPSLPPGNTNTIQYLIPGRTTNVELLKQVKNWQSPSRDPWSNCLINSRETIKGQTNYYFGREKDNSKTICGRVG